MPTIKAAIKHLRKSEKLRKVNRIAKNKLKDAIKDLIKLAKQGSREEAEKQLPKIFSLIDKTAKKHLLHKNNAARKKSKLAHLFATAK